MGRIIMCKTKFCINQIINNPRPRMTTHIINTVTGDWNANFKIMFVDFELKLKLL